MGYSSVHYSLKVLKMDITVSNQAAGLEYDENHYKRRYSQSYSPQRTRRKANTKSKK